MNLLKEHQQARFSAAASGYDRLARVQRAVAENVIRGLTFADAPKRVLDIGCGTGNLTRRIASIWPDADVEGIDLAPGMIENARRLNAASTRPRFTVADAATFTSAQPYDVLVSSSTLHWVQPLDSTFLNLARLLTPGGRFVFAVMLKNTLRELHAARTRVVPNNPPTQRMPSNENVRTALNSSGFQIEASEVEERLTHSESAKALLHELHELGVTGGGLSRGTHPLSRIELHRLLEYYNTHFRDSQGVFATYHVGHYWGTRHA